MDLSYVLSVSGGTPYVPVVRDMALVLFEVPVEQGAFVQVVLQDVPDPHIGNGICLQGPFTGIVQAFRPVGLMELYDPHGPFISYFRIVPLGEYRLHTAQYMVAVSGRFLFKELRAPVTIIFMGAAKMLPVGIIAAFFRMAPVQGDPLLVVIDFDNGTGVMDGGLFPDIAVGNAIIALVRGEIDIPHLLHLRPSIFLELVRTLGQGLQVFPFHGLEQLPATGLLSFEQQVVVRHQQTFYLPVQISEGEEHHFPYWVVDTLIGKVHGVLHQGLVLGGIPPGGVYGAVVMPCKILKATINVRLIFTGPCHRRFQVVRYNGLGHATIKVQGIGATTDQVLPFLAPAGLHIGIMAIGKDGHEHFHRDHFPSVPINNMELLAGVVDEHFVPCLVLELHGTLGLCVFAPVMFHELGVTIRLFGLLYVLLIMI